MGSGLTFCHSPSTARHKPPLSDILCGDFDNESLGATISFTARLYWDVAC